MAFGEHRSIRAFGRGVCRFTVTQSAVSVLGMSVGTAEWSGIESFSSRGSKAWIGRSDLQIRAFVRPYEIYQLSYLHLIRITGLQFAWDGRNQDSALGSGRARLCSGAPV